MSTYPSYHTSCKHTKTETSKPCTAKSLYLTCLCLWDWSHLAPGRLHNPRSQKAPVPERKSPLHKAQAGSLGVARMIDYPGEVLSCPPGFKREKMRYYQGKREKLDITSIFPLSQQVLCRTRKYALQHRIWSEIQDQKSQHFYAFPVPYLLNLTNSWCSFLLCFLFAVP